VGGFVLDGMDVAYCIEMRKQEGCQEWNMACFLLRSRDLGSKGLTPAFLLFD
jgi:hypothetical protein